MDASIDKLIKKANEGLADAQCQLAFCYLTGDRVERSDIKAFYFFSEAAKQNNPVAQFKLARFYKDGIVAQKDPEKAFKLFSLAAEGGVNDALFDLGY